MLKRRFRPQNRTSGPFELRVIPSMPFSGTLVSPSWRNRTRRFGADSFRMIIGRPTVLFWVAVLVLGTGGLWLGQSLIVEPVGKSVRHPLSVLPDDLDLGQVWATSAERRRVRVFNTSDTPVEVVRFEALCNCTAVEPASVTIAPKSVRWIEVAFNFSRRAENGVSEHRWPVSVEIVPVIRGARTIPPVWRFAGTVRSPLVLSPAAVSFGEELIAGGRSTSIVVRADVEWPGSRLRANAEDPRVHVQVRNRKGFRNSFNLDVRAEPGMARGTLNTRVLVQVQTPAGRHVPPISLPVTGMIVDDLCTVPRYIHLKGNATEQNLVVQSRSGTALKDVEIHAKGSTGIIVEELQQQGLHSNQYRVKLVAGQASALVRYIDVSAAKEGDGSIMHTRVPVVVTGDRDRRK